ncbi:FAD-dependent oxidoreductase [Cupriavidus basilensis]
MKVVIVGAGVIGMSAAWRLAGDGHEVTVLERHGGPGEETSFANGGQLSYSYGVALAGSGVLAKVPGWLLRPDSPIALPSPRGTLRSGAGWPRLPVPATPLPAKPPRASCCALPFTPAT